MARRKANKFTAVNLTKERRQIDKQSNEEESLLKNIVVNHAKENCQIGGQDSVLKLRLSSLKKQKYKFKEYIGGPSFKQIVNQYPDIKLSPELKRSNLNPKIVVADNVFQKRIRSFVKLKERLTKLSWAEETTRKCFNVTCSDCKIGFNVMKEYVQNLANLKAKVSQLQFWNEDDPQNCRISITTNVNHEIVDESVPSTNDKNENNATSNPKVIDEPEKLKFAKESENEEMHAANTNESEIKIEVHCEDEEMEVTNVYDTNIENLDTIESCEENQTENTNESEIKIEVQCEDEEMEVTNVYDTNIENLDTIESCEENQAENANESEIKIEVQCEDEEMEVMNVYDSNIENLDTIEICENNTETNNNTNVLVDINVDDCSSNENQNCITNVSKDIAHPSLQNIFSLHKNIKIPEAVLQCNMTPVIKLNSMDVFNWYEEEVHKLRNLVNVRSINSHTTESQSLPSCRNVIELESGAETTSCIVLPSNTIPAELQNHNGSINNSETLKESSSSENNESNGSKEVKRNSNGRQPLLTEWFEKSTVVPQNQTTIPQQQQHVNSQQHRMPPKISQQTVTPQAITSHAITQQSRTHQAIMQPAKSQLQPSMSYRMPQVNTIRQSRPQFQQQQRYPQLQQQRYPQLQQQRYPQLPQQRYPQLPQQRYYPHSSQNRRYPILEHRPVTINILRNQMRYSHPTQNIRNTNNLPTYSIIPAVSQNNSNIQNQPIRLQLNATRTGNNASNSAQQNERRSQTQYLTVKPSLDLMEMGNRYSRETQN